MATVTSDEYDLVSLLWLWGHCASPRWGIEAIFQGPEHSHESMNVVSKAMYAPQGRRSR